MTAFTIILIFAAAMLSTGLVAIIAWFGYSSWLTRVERRLARRKGMYRTLVATLATRDRRLLEPEIHRMGTLLDLEALEAVLEEQARGTSTRPAWLLDVYDRLGLVDKYVTKLRNARKWRERAFAAELLGRVGNAKAVPALLETVRATRVEDGDVREIALRALARIADPRAVEPLIRALQTSEVWLAPRIADILSRHGDLVVDPLISFLGQSAPHPARAWAANVLGEVQAQRAFAVLVAGLSDPEDEVRAKSATALGRLGDRRAISYLLDHLLTDPAPFVRTRIAATLGQFHEPEVIDRLVRALGDQAWWVRMRSVEALGQIGSVAEGPLLVALDDPDPEIRSRAAVALERLEVPARLVRMIQRGEGVFETMDTLAKFATAGAYELLADLLRHPAAAVRAAVVGAIRRAQRRDIAPRLVELARQDPDAIVRASAFDALGDLEAKAAAPAALEGLADPDPGVRASAIDLLAKAGNPETIGRLRDCTSDPEPAVRVAAATALGRLGTAAAQPDFQRLIEDGDIAVRAAAALGAAEAGLTTMATGLAGLLGDAAPPVQRAAAVALGKLGDPSAVRALARRFDGATPELRDAIIEATSQIDLKAVTGLLDSLVRSRDEAGLLGAIRILSRRSAPAAARALCHLAENPEPAVRSATVEALGRQGGPEAAEATAAGLHDPSETVRAAAVDAGARLQLEAHGGDILRMLQGDPAPRVRERAALASGWLRLGGGEAALLTICHQEHPVAVRAAAALALGMYQQESIVARVLEMGDGAAVRDHLLAQLKSDAAYRLLARKLSPARRLELRALGTAGPEVAGTVLAQGMHGLLDPGERMRLISGLRAFQGVPSRAALLRVVRSDPSPEVRAAALTGVGGLLESTELLEVARRALGDPAILVRRAAVALFAKVDPEQGLPVLLRALRPDDDPAVLAAAAELVESAFPTFMELALKASPDGAEALLIARVARYLHHPDLPRLLPIVARSALPEVREAVALLGEHRPEIVARAVLEGMTLDPVIAVRRVAVAAGRAAARWDLLAHMAEDPEAEIRREVAVACGRSPESGPAGRAALDRLAEDADPAVRAAAYAARLLQGTPASLPPDVRPEAAAVAIRQAADLPGLRQLARTAPEEERRLAAALALAWVDDAVAREVARTDPVPAIRHRVTGALELVRPPAAEGGAG